MAEAHSLGSTGRRMKSERSVESLADWVDGGRFDARRLTVIRVVFYGEKCSIVYICHN